jgi:1-acyl-sn-glycerol-3-phosphate acyltransferase
VRIQVIGLEKFAREKSYVFISNHTSNLDPPAVALAIPQTLRFIGKSSLAKIPIFGWAAKLARMIFIDRSNHAKAVENINKAIKDLKDGISAFFFAEGTRSVDGVLQSFKKGGVVLALKAKLPIIPITIIDSYRLLPKSAIRIRPGILKVIIGDPIDTSTYSDEDKDILLQKIRGVIEETLNKYSLPVTA